MDLNQQETTPTRKIVEIAELSGHLYTGLHAPCFTIWIEYKHAQELPLQAANALYVESLIYASNYYDKMTRIN